jgi:hypothetical protein
MLPNSAKESYDRHSSPELATVAILRRTKDSPNFPIIVVIVIVIGNSA